jgi:hypothetical protein
MQEVFQTLSKKREHLRGELRKVEKAIEAIQAVCEHNMKYEGHDSHKDYYRCTICECEDRV